MPHKWLAYVLTGILALCLSGCGADIRQTPMLPTITASPTLTPGPTDTPAPTATSVLAGIPPQIELPEPQKITPPKEALAVLVPRGAAARLGLGIFQSMSASPDGNYIAVASSVGVHLFDARTLAHVWTARTLMDVIDLDWSPDSSLISAGIKEEGFVVLDARTGVDKWRFGDYEQARFSPDGQSLAAMGCAGKDADGNCAAWQVRVWKSNTGRVVGSHTFQADTVPWIWLSAGEILVDTIYRSPIVWDIRADTVVSLNDTLLLGSYRLGVISPDSTKVAVIVDNAIVVLKWPGGRVLRSISIDNSLEIPILIWSPDSSQLIAYKHGEYGDPVVVDIATGKTVALTLADSGSKYTYGAQAWSPDGSLIAMPVNSGSVWSTDPASSFTSPIQQYGLGIWDTHTGELVQRIGVARLRTIREIAWPQRNNLIVLSNGQGSSQVVNIDPDRQSAAPVMVEGTGWYGYTAIGWSPDGRELVSGGENNVNLWDIDSRQAIKTCRRDDKLIYGPDNMVQWLDDAGPRIAAHISALQNDFSPGTYSVFDMATCKNTPVADLPYVPSSLWSPDHGLKAELSGNMSGSMGNPYTLTVIRAADGTIVYQAPIPHTEDINRVRFAWSSDGRHIAAVKTGAKLTPDHGFESVAVLVIFAANTGDVERTFDLKPFDGQSISVSKIIWSPDDRLIITAHGSLVEGEGPYNSIGKQAVLNVWDANSGRLVRTLSGHTNDIVDIAWSPDKTTLASASVDGTIILWDFAR